MECLERLVSRIDQALGSANISFEIVLVNDCSPDNSWAKISDLSRSRPFLVGINLRKNVGQDNAIMAGLRYSAGRIIVIMDDDLQHDPGDIRKLVNGLNNGHDVCFGRYRTQKQKWWKRFGSRLNGKLAEILLKKPANIYLSPFKAIRRSVVDEICRYHGPYAYIDGLILSVTSRFTQVDVTHHRRFSGQSNFTLVRSLRVWMRLLTSYSVVPLRVASVSGFLAAGIGFFLGIVYLSWHFVFGGSVEGWTTLIITILFIGGIQLIGIGLLGEYIGRIFLTVNTYPQFSVLEIIDSRE